MSSMRLAVVKNGQKPAEAYQAVNCPGEQQTQQQLQQQQHHAYISHTKRVFIRYKLKTCFD